jgi:hypothetical protein
MGRVKDWVVVGGSAFEAPATPITFIGLRGSERVLSVLGRQARGHPLITHGHERWELLPGYGIRRRLPAWSWLFLHAEREALASLRQSFRQSCERLFLGFLRRPWGLDGSSIHSQEKVEATLDERG